MGPRAPTGLPRAPTRPRGAPKVVPKEPQELPKGRQEAPKGPQGSPQAAPRGSKSLPRSPQTLQKSSQEVPKSQKSLVRTHDTFNVHLNKKMHELHPIFSKSSVSLRTSGHRKNHGFYCVVFTIFMVWPRCAMSSQPLANYL